MSKVVSDDLARRALKRLDEVPGYNRHKPGRPSHTYHSYLIGQLRLVLEVEVRAGDQSHACHTLPGLMDLLARLPADGKPELIRGDCDFGTDRVMRELEAKGYDYLFKLRKSKWVDQLIKQQHGKGNWMIFNERCEAKTAQLQLFGWHKARCVVIVQRRLPSSSTHTLALTSPTDPI